MVRVLRVIARPNSKALRAYQATLGRPDAIASGIAPKPQFDLVNHGGKSMAAMTYTNFYLGSGWRASDKQSIDGALAAAMTDPSLNGIVGQYFGGKAPTTVAKGSQVLNTKVGRRFDQKSVTKVVGHLLTRFVRYDYRLMAHHHRRNVQAEWGRYSEAKRRYLETTFPYMTQGFVRTTEASAATGVQITAGSAAPA